MYASVKALGTQAWLVGKELVRGWHACTMRIPCETRSAHMEETPVGNVKRRVTALGGNSGAGTLRGAWYIMAATVQGQSYLGDGLDLL
jgi:hypothetical protein